MLTTTNTVLLAGLEDPANEALWTEFHDRYLPVIVGFATKLGLPHEDAQDAAQEILLRFVTEYRAGRYDRDRGRLRSWIFTIARSRVFDLARKRGRLDAWRGDSVLANVPAADTLDAEWDAEWSRAVLRAAFAELRTESRVDDKTLRAFEGVVLGGRAPGAVAAELDMTKNSVYVAKHRLLGRLREIIQRLEDEY